MSLNFENIIYEKTKNIAKITLNRPAVYNAMDSKLVSELNTALIDAKNDPKIKVVIITGAGEKAFCSGLDIKEFKDKSPYELREFIEKFLERTYILMNMGKPTIAAVNGLALAGGFELALSCDMIIASEKAKFGLPEINIGVFPGIAVALLPRLIGRARTFELILTGRMISAKEAEEMGLVNKVVPAERLWDEVNDLARQLAEKSQVALRLAKTAIYRGMDMEYVKAVADACETFLVCMSTEDAKEGISAFLEKRKPVWKDK